MKNKGFTLMELLGVIIILALLMIIVFPSIVNSVKNSSNKTDDLTKELIYNAADLFIDEHINDYPKQNGNKYAIELKTLVDEGLLVSPIKLSDSDADITNAKCIQVIYQGDYNYALKNSGTCEQTKILPSEYQKVEYIASTGTQYIDMQYSYKVNDEINIEFMKTNDTGAIQGVFGNGNVTSYKGVSLYISSNGTISSTVGGTLGIDYKSYSTPISNNIKYSVKIQQNKVYLDNELIITLGNVLKDGTQSDFSLFRRWGTNVMHGRIYSFSVNRASELIFNLIPCYRIADNVIGLYDLVEEKFYTNSGTGTFEKGSDI